MRRIIITLLVLSLAFVCYAADAGSFGRGETYEVNVRGVITNEDLVIQLVRANTQETIDTITFDDLSALNTNGYLVSTETYSLVYSYVSSIESTTTVNVAVSSEGLSRDGGETYPISISFVSPESDSETISWDAKALEINGSADYTEYQQFKIRLDNSTMTNINAGNYSGTINFQLIAE